MAFAGAGIGLPVPPAIPGDLEELIRQKGCENLIPR